MGYAFQPLTAVLQPAHCSNPEDQQRINSFSKLNNRLRGLEEKIEALKVVLVWLQVYIANTHIADLQQEKEALDDLSTELELADEDQMVMCVHSYWNNSLIRVLSPGAGIELERHSCTSLIAVL